MFRIGEFSKIAQVSGRQLRHYDQLGLLKPDYTDPESGFRYYRAEQLPRLNQILALKELGLSLQQIGKLLNDNISSDEIRGMLMLKRSQIEQLLEEEAARFRYIESRIDQIDKQGKFQDYDLVLKSVPSRRYLALRSVFPSLRDAQRLGLEMHQALGPFSKSLGPFTVVIHQEIWEDENLDMEIGFTLEDDVDSPVSLADGRELSVRNLPGAKDMLTVARVGMPLLGHGSYGALGQWAQAKGYHFAGPGREVYFQFPFPGREGETVSEIQFPVRKASPGISAL